MSPSMMTPTVVSRICFHVVISVFLPPGVQTDHPGLHCQPFLVWLIHSVVMQGGEKSTQIFFFYWTTSYYLNYFVMLSNSNAFEVSFFYMATKVHYLYHSVCTWWFFYSGPSTSEQEMAETSQSEAARAEVGHIWKSAHMIGNCEWIRCSYEITGPWKVPMVSLEYTFNEQSQSLVISCLSLIIKKPFTHQLN